MDKFKIFLISLVCLIMAVSGFATLSLLGNYIYPHMVV